MLKLSALFSLLVLIVACSAPNPNTPTVPAAPPAAATAPASPVSATSNPRPTQPAATNTPRATNTPAPTLTPSVTPSPTPVPARLIQLMDGGCCVNPGWSSDSESVLFIDKPSADQPTGLYRVRLDAPFKSELWTERIAFYTQQYDYAQIPEAAGTRLIRTTDGKELRVRNGGRSVLLSPDRTRIFWSETRDTFPIENRVTNIMLAPVSFDNGEPSMGEAQRVIQVLRGGGSWLDNTRLLLNGRLSRDTEESTLFVYDLETGKQTPIVSAERMRLTPPSRGASWLAYVITNDADASRNGLWVVRTDGTDARKLDFFGALQWRDDTRFIYAPFEMNATTHSFYEYNIETGKSKRLTPPDKPFRIASGDWSVSPDGNKIVFSNAADNNLWVWQFSE